VSAVVDAFLSASVGVVDFVTGGGTASTRSRASRPAGAGLEPAPLGKSSHMLFILWLIAVVLVVYGIVRLVRGDVLVGVLLIVAGLLVGPGGVSVFATS